LLIRKPLMCPALPPRYFTIFEKYALSTGKSAIGDSHHDPGNHDPEDHNSPVHHDPSSPDPDDHNNHTGRSSSHTNRGNKLGEVPQLPGE
jgi:hypothetical protein